jgi:hypothetical protein
MNSIIAALLGTIGRSKWSLCVRAVFIVLGVSFEVARVPIWRRRRLKRGWNFIPRRRGAAIFGPFEPRRSAGGPRI